MTTVVPLLFGIAVFCLWWSCWPRASRRERRPSAFLTELKDDLVAAGWHRVTLAGLAWACLAAGVFAFVIVMALTAVSTIAAAFGCIAAYGPIAFVRVRARRQRARLRDLWPDVVDHVASAVRAGLALPESIAQLAIRGPEELRPAFAGFARNYRASGNFNACLDDLKEQLADPVADRLIEAVRVAREVGGTDLGRLLRTLSGFLREDARTRSELEARQSWTVNAARLALCAPWLVLALLAMRSDSLQAYQSGAGVLVLALGGGVSLLAYRIMRRIGRLPEEVRVMR